MPSALTATWPARMLAQLNHFDQLAVRRRADDFKSGVFDFRTEVRVEFVTVAVTFADFPGFVDARRFGSGLDDAGVCAETHRSALRGDGLLRFHEVDDRERGAGIEFSAVRLLHAADIAGEFDDGALHSETDSEERNLVRAGVFHGFDLSGNSAVAEPAGDQNAVHPLEDLIQIAVVEFFRFNGTESDLCGVRDSGMRESFIDALIRVAQSDVLADDGDFNGSVHGVENG